MSGDHSCENCTRLDELLTLEQMKNLDLQADLDRARDEIDDLKSELNARPEGPEVITVKCTRCDRPFNTVDGVFYCSRDCELGFTHPAGSRCVA
jgi:hypothetical protein